MFVRLDYFFFNVDISLLRQLYSKNTVLFNLTISGHDTFSALCDFYREYREIFVLVLGVICTLLNKVEQ